MIERSSISIDNKNFSYWESGEGEPILYLHGFPTSGYLWRNVMEITGQAFWAIAPDFPGFGESNLLHSAHTWEALVDWTDRFVGSMDIKLLHLAVHDWGGLIGLAWACKNPHKVASLLVTDTTFRSTDKWHAAATQWRTPGVGEEMLGSLNRDGLGNLMHGISPNISEEAIDQYWKGLATPDRRAAKLEMYRSLDFEMLGPLEPILPTVAPGKVKVIWGAQDPFVPAKVGLRMGETLSADVTLLEAASHFLQEDAGKEVGEMHLAHLLALGG